MKAISVGDIVKAVKGSLLQGDENAKVTYVTTDSREVREGTLYVPIIGERVDGHRFIASAMESGAVCSFSSQKEVQMANGAIIYVEDTLTALQDFAAWYRNLFPQVKVLGVTGSVGKTTTKEMIACVLERKYKVLKTFGNMNSQIGLARMMFELSDEIEIAVIEMGISEHGEMNKLVHIARPELAVMTNIGMSHIGNLGSRENICKEKSGIITCFPENGVLYICSNGDLKEMSKTCIDKKQCEKGNCQFVFYGTENDPDYYADDIRVAGDHMHFMYHHESMKEEIELSVLGQHNVNNALIALCIGERFGVEMNVMKEALRDYQPLKMRGDVLNHKGYTIVDDTYNASTDSINSGLSALFDRAQTRRSIAVLADVLELGDFSKEAHECVGEFIVEEAKKGRVLGELITYGENAAYISEVVRRKMGQIPNHHFNSHQEIIEYLHQILRDGDVILLKGSRGMAMDQVVKALLEE